MDSSRSGTQRPTARQGEYLAFIAAFTDRYGIAPSFEDIGRHFMTTPPSVNSMIKMLEARGFLRRVPGKARSLQVVVESEGPVPVARQPRGAAVHDAALRIALHMAVATVARLVPALRGADDVHARGALDAVRIALEMACTDAGASADERRLARGAFARAIALAQRVDGSPHRNP